MRKFLYSLILIMVLISVMGCNIKKENEQKTLFSVKEIKGKYIVDSNELSLINMEPCIVSNGKAYIYDNDWNEIESNNNIVKVYNGDTFCALDCEGNIINTAKDNDNYEGYPLTTAGVRYNVEEMLKHTEKEKIISLSGNPLNGEYCIAYLEGGYTRLFANGQMIELSDSIDVGDISGSFILSEAGDVYRVSYGDNNSNIRMEQISEKRYLNISACMSADRCIGICEDGTVTIWSDVDLNFTFNAENAKSAAMGFDYGIVLCDNGDVEFHSSNSTLEKQLSDYFHKLNTKVSAIACGYNCIAITLHNGDVNVITF